jgi:hypothetical protein
VASSCRRNKDICECLGEGRLAEGNWGEESDGLARDAGVSVGRSETAADAEGAGVAKRSMGMSGAVSPPTPNAGEGVRCAGRSDSGKENGRGPRGGLNKVSGTRIRVLRQTSR